MSVTDNLLAGACLMKANTRMEDNIGRVYDLFPVLKSRAVQVTGTGLMDVQRGHGSFHLRPVPVEGSEYQGCPGKGRCHAARFLTDGEAPCRP